MTTSEIVVWLVIIIVLLYMYKPELFTRAASTFKNKVSKYGYTKPLVNLKGWSPVRPNPVERCGDRKVSNMAGPAYPINSNIAFGPSNIYASIPEDKCPSIGTESHM